MSSEQSSPTATTETWWRNGVVYQVYPRSFADANGDGTGDVHGIIDRLDHLEALGIDAIWISPWYPSPLLDGGYDVVDYRDIDPRFGTLDDARRLTAEAHARGIKIIVDIVPNHTSSGHHWFREAIADPPGSPSRERYMIRPGRGADGSEPPNNWVAVFGGSAWTRLDDGEWYLHLFDVSQPDLDWNHPEVRAEFRDIFRFWIDLGVDGFRIDVAHGLVKHPDLPDVARHGELLESETLPDGSHPYWDRDGVHEIIREWRAVLDEAEAEQQRDLMMVAEAWVHPNRLPLYLRADEYHQSFNFDFLTCDWDAEQMRPAIDRAIEAAESVGSTPTWALSNH
ncbi:MAG: alpha-amylase family glycosyl hydrolase, partial [Ilumatobacteraceae bacterium]